MVAALVVICLVVGLVLRLPKTYTVAEIDEALRRDLVQQLDSGVIVGSGVDLRLLDIKQIDDTIITPYVWQTDIPIVGYLRFVAVSAGRYKLVANKSMYWMWGNEYFDGVDVFSARNEAGELKSYYLFLGRESLGSRLRVYDTSNGDKLLAELEPEGDFAAYIWERPEAGRYVVLGEDGSELYARNFAVSRAVEDGLNLELMLDWPDCRTEKDNLVYSRLTLLDRPARPLRAQVAMTTIPYMAWYNAVPGVMNGDAYRSHQVDIGRLAGYEAQPEDVLRLPLYFDYSGNRLWRSAADNRAFAISFNSRLNEAGQYVEVCGRWQDYDPEALAPGDMQVMWSVYDVGEYGLTVPVMR